MARTGRPKKAPDGLTNDIKVRIDDNTLLELNKLCEHNGLTKADAIRIALEDLISYPAGEEHLWTLINKAGFNIQLVVERLKLIDTIIRRVMDEVKDTDVEEKTLRLFVSEVVTLKAVEPIFDYLNEKQREFLELKPEDVKPEPEKQPRRKAKSK